MLGQRPMAIEDYLRILRRRFWLALIPAAIVSVATYLVSLKIPNRFTSQTLILIEQQKVPDSYVKSIVTGELNERLASMQEQILSRTRLQPEVQRFDLYGDTSLPMDDKVDTLRKAITVTPVRPMAETGANELPGFEIAVTLSTARVAQQVCADITSMFIEESLKERESEAQNTTDFLNRELDDAKQNLDQQGQKLAAFKEKYIGEMPEDEQTNMNLLNTLNTQLEAVNQALSRDQQSRSFDQALLDEAIAQAKKASEHPDEAVTTNPETLDQQLERAETDLTELRSQFTDSYPDVIAKKAEIEQLKQKINAGKIPDAKADSAAVAAPKTSSDSGKSNTAADATETKAADATKDPASATPASTVPETPQIRQLRTQLFVVNEDMRDKTKRQDQLRSDISKFEARLHLSPVVEQELEQLTRDQATAKDIYNDRLQKRDNARMATNLERRQQGETFNILDPASLPEKPSFPNRPLFAGGGFAGGLALGVGLILLFEYRDKSIVGEPDVEFFLKLPTLAAVPYIEPETKGKLAGILRRPKPKQTAEASA
jgi:polysaccharide chain length determinant protein (PEP-CTERM system associated)